MTTDRTPLENLSDSGVAIWLDDLSRQLISSGELGSLTRDRNVVGITTNPTIFAGALAQGDSYRVQLTELASRDTSVDDAVTTITTDDVRSAADVLQPIYDATAGQDGRVSIEVDPRLAHDVEGTVASAKHLSRIIDRPNIFIKIPATVEGLEAIKQTIGAGISVNVTLIFSLERYHAVVDAYLSGLEIAHAAGIDISGIRSVASFFVSRVDVAVDALLDNSDANNADELRSTIAIANARLAYGYHEQVLNSQRWQELAQKGAHPQRPLWASTGVKDPKLADTIYVDELVANGTVNTMPRKTLEAVAEHGTVSSPTTNTITPHLGSAQAQLDALAAAGIDLAKVTAELESEGVTKFIDSWNELIATVEEGLKTALPSSPTQENV